MRARARTAGRHGRVHGSGARDRRTQRIDSERSILSGGVAPRVPCGPARDGCRGLPNGAIAQDRPLARILRRAISPCRTIAFRPFGRWGWRYLPFTSDRTQLRWQAELERDGSPVSPPSKASAFPRLTRRRPLTRPAARPRPTTAPSTFSRTSRASSSAKSGGSASSFGARRSPGSDSTCSRRDCVESRSATQMESRSCASSRRRPALAPGGAPAGFGGYDRVAGGRIRYVACVLEGSSFRVAAARSVLAGMRLLVPTRVTAGYFGTSTSAAAALAKHVQIGSANALVSAIETLRSFLAPARFGMRADEDQR